MSLFKKCVRAMVALSAAVAGAAAGAHVTVSDAWVRGTVEGQTATGAYMVIASDRDTTLVGVRAAAADSAVLHEMKMHGNMMMMMPIERLVVPAGTSVTLDEHNYHIMLEGLKRPAKPGDTIELTLKFVDAKGVPEEVRVTALAREISAHGEHAHHMMGHE